MEFALLKLQMVYYTKQVFNFLWVKCGPAILWAALVPHSIALQGLCVLFGLDFICGLWVAKRTHTLSSSGMRRGISKLLIYFVFISAVALAERTMLETNGITLVAIGLLAMTEVLSITENLVMLGLPIPFAAKVLRLVNNKAGNYGMKIGADADSFATLKDMVDLLEDVIPTYRNALLRVLLTVYLSHWYEFSRDLDSASLAGTPDLVTERVRNQLSRVMIDIRAALTRESVPPGVQDIFLNQWIKSLYACLLAKIDAKIADESASTADKIDSIRESVALMLYRVIKETARYDTEEAGLSPSTDSPAA